MSSELQDLTDALAMRVGRPLVVEDRQQRMLVYSRHGEPMDDVRRDSILRRHTTPAVINWFRRQGLTEATEPMRFGACDELEMLPRVCIPVRHRGQLLGFLWFLDPDQTMTDTEVDIAATAVCDFALALHRENLISQLVRERETEALRNLVAGEAGAQTHAARHLIEGGHFAQSGPVIAMVVVPVLSASSEADDGLRGAIEDGLTEVRRHFGPRESLHLVQFDHGLLVVTGEPRTGLGVRACGEELLRSAASATRQAHGVESVAVGIGAAMPSLDQVRTSYDQARLAARAAAQLPNVGRVAYWEQLGVYRMLLQLSEDEVASASLHPGLARLIEDRAAAPLVETLETYLDFAGNAQRTAERLFLHRTTLYYRLRRISKLTGTDLQDGYDRLVLHLGLKVARLSGRYRPAEVPPAS